LQAAVQPVAGVPTEVIVLQLQLGGHPMLVKVASTAAQDEAQACPRSLSRRPVWAEGAELASLLLGAGENAAVNHELPA
jgi:hypothetical protein